MPLTTTGRNKLLDSGKGAFTHVGALTSIDGTEVAGGSYARQAVTWQTAGSGLTDNTAQLTIPIPASTTVQAIGLYDAVSAGALLAYVPIGSSGQLLRGAAAVTDLANNVLTSDSHGLSADDRVMVWQIADEAFPASTPSLLATVLYYAATITTSTFKLSTTASGANIVDITGLGELAWAKTVPNTFSSAGNLTVAIGQLDFALTFA